jgi:hypothetical protein
MKRIQHEIKLAEKTNKHSLKKLSLEISAYRETSQQSKLGMAR